MKEIKRNMFENNEISKLSIEEGVEKFDFESFRQNRISEVHFPKSVKQVFFRSFADNGLKKVIYENRNITFGKEALEELSSNNEVIESEMDIIGPKSEKTTKYANQYGHNLIFK